MDDSLTEKYFKPGKEKRPICCIYIFEIVFILKYNFSKR